MTIFNFINSVSSGAFDNLLRVLYGSSEHILLRQKSRLICSAERFSGLFPLSDDISVFSAPARTEIGGNHTDHQHGCVLAAAVSLDILAVVSYTDDRLIRIFSDGSEPFEIDLAHLEKLADEHGTSASIVRGIAASFEKNGITVGGFNAFISSDIPCGIGLSSSAAFELLICSILNSRLNSGGFSQTKLAEIANFAENSYFGKSCGLMDQLVCAVGGLAFIDFAVPDEPSLKKLDFDFPSTGYSVCITDTGSSHADLSSDYSAVVSEMCHTAKLLGTDFLRNADENEFYRLLPELRKSCSDRELLRAAHFFSENARVCLEYEALRNGDTEGFFSLVNESGRSSADLLQNLCSAYSPQSQGIPLALMLTRRFLNGCGASRVHGGGFGGSIQAFVPTYLTSAYSAEMERIFGSGCCLILNIRSVGAAELTL